MANLIFTYNLSPDKKYNPNELHTANDNGFLMDEGFTMAQGVTLTAEQLKNLPDIIGKTFSFVNNGYRREVTVEQVKTKVELKKRLRNSIGFKGVEWVVASLVKTGKVDPSFKRVKTFKIGMCFWKYTITPYSEI